MFFRWLVSSDICAYHTHDSRRSAKGFPDLVLAKNGVVLIVELKTDTGVATPDQVAWLLADA